MVRSSDPGRVVPRVAESRPPAEPTTDLQRDRHQRILRVAARLGADHGLERVQMHEVAKEAEVAIATLYRYFPSKMHLFRGVLRHQVGRIADLPRTAGPPVDAVCELLLQSTRRLLAAPRLANAMMQANNSANAASDDEAGVIDRTFQDLLLRTAGIGEPSAEDAQLARLIQQAWYGVLVSALNGRLSALDAEADIERACELVLGPWVTTGG